MKKYGFFGGSFNPPTLAHEEMAKQALKEFNLDKVFFVPMGNSYPKEGLVEENHRYAMLKIICENNTNIEVLDIELNKKERLQTKDAFLLLKNAYSQEQLYFIMGADNLQKLPNWKDAEYLAQNYEYIILKRDNVEIETMIEQNQILKRNSQNFHYIQKQQEIKHSSTQIREDIKNKTGKIKSKIRKEVMQYIIENKLYE